MGKLHAHLFLLKEKNMLKNILSLILYVFEGDREQPALLPGRESDVARGAASHRADTRRATAEIRCSQAHDVREASTVQKTFLSVLRIRIRDPFLF
jgi:hypothetical protein